MRRRTGGALLESRLTHEPGLWHGVLQEPGAWGPGWDKALSSKGSWGKGPGWSPRCWGCRAPATRALGQAGGASMVRGLSSPLPCPWAL